MKSKMEIIGSLKTFTILSVTKTFRLQHQPKNRTKDNNTQILLLFQLHFDPFRNVFEPKLFSQNCVIMIETLGFRFYHCWVLLI